MKRLPLQAGKFALVDDEDFLKVGQMRWIYCKASYSKGATYYVRHRDLETKEIIYLHRLLMNPPAGMQVDHINRDGLDNRRSNLRVCTHLQNMMNRRPSMNSKSGYVGVIWDKKVGKWHAQITHESKHINLGYFTDSKKAAMAYNEAAKKYKNEFAYLNPV